MVAKSKFLGAGYYGTTISEHYDTETGPAITSNPDYIEGFDVLAGI